jgi:putative hydrolase of the HAD superfamily
MLRFALFDLDDTLYAPHTGLWDAIGERINRYMIERVGLDAASVRVMRDHYLHAFGTTLNGLRHEYHIDPDDYLDFVHDLPLDHYLQPDPALNGMLGRLPLTKAIFTNSDARHARRVTERLGVTRHFTHIIDIHALGFANKPEPPAYARALEIVQARPEACVFIEDSRRNLLPARALGMLTVWVSETGSANGVDFQIPHILDLERVLASVLGQVR